MLPADLVTCFGLPMYRSTVLLSLVPKKWMNSYSKTSYRDDFLRPISHRCCINSAALFPEMKAPRVRCLRVFGAVVKAKFLDRSKSFIGLPSRRPSASWERSGLNGLPTRWCYSGFLYVTSFSIFFTEMDLLLPLRKED